MTTPHTANIVYLLVNEAMSGYVKIGITKNLEQRIRSLDTTGVPLPFECFYACIVADAAKVERQILNAFMDHRVRSSREFFEIAPERAVAILKLVELQEVTPGKDFVESEEDLEALAEARSRRARFNFKMVGIKPGAELIFSRDNTIRALVVDERLIEFKGKPATLSSSAQLALGVDYPIAGTDYWTYDGEILDERRRRMEFAD